MAAQLDYTVVDAFTSTAFRGNPASIIVLENGHSLKDEQMLLIAREFNLSETAFVVPFPSEGTDDKSTAHFGLRWFTPKAEVSLCGHATLASARVLFSSEMLVPRDVTKVAFKTLSGILTAKKITVDNKDERIELEFPAGIPTEVSSGDALYEKTLGLVSQATEGKAKVLYIGRGNPDGPSFKDFLMIEVDNSFDLENAFIKPGPFMDLAPDYVAIIVTTRANDSRSTFIARVFGPALGVPEDPVTGSAHCMLGPYWKQRLNLQSNAILKSRQVSERGGEVEVQWDEESGTCKLRGNATMVAKGVIFPPV